MVGLAATILSFFVGGTNAMDDFQDAIRGFSMTTRSEPLQLWGQPSEYSTLFKKAQDYSDEVWYGGALLTPQEQTPNLPIQFAHGTTTLAFIFAGGIVVAVDSRASLGGFVGSKTTQKVLPIHSHMIGTMAGGAADCMIWIRKLRCEAGYYEDQHGRRMSVACASRILSHALYNNRQFGLSVGSMIMGFDDVNSLLVGETKPNLYYVDNTGMRLQGDCFAVGSGSILALGILDTERRYDMSRDEAIALGVKAIRHATLRDAYSGGYINVFLITAEKGWEHVFAQDIDEMVYNAASSTM
jgi:20S proteasome subunit beta 5